MDLLLILWLSHFSFNSTLAYSEWSLDTLSLSFAVNAICCTNIGIERVIKKVVLVVTCNSNIMPGFYSVFPNKSYGSGKKNWSDQNLPGSYTKVVAQPFFFVFFYF